MRKVKYIVILLSINLFGAFAQSKKIPLAIGDNLPIAIGVHYEKNNSFSTGYQYDKGIMADYNTNRNRLGIDLLYGLSKRLQTESALGISTYNSEVCIGKFFSPASSSISINTANLFVSQKVILNALYVPFLDVLKFTLNPFVGLEYEQFLPFNRKHEKGHSDLFSDEANYEMNVLDIPAVSGVTKIPVGILSGVAGLSFEMLVCQRIGVVWEGGYSYALSGHSQIDVKYRYRDTESPTLHFKSDKRGIILVNVKLRYYF